MKNKSYLLVELTALYIGLPTLFYFDLVPVPKIAALLGVALACTLILWYDHGREFSRLFAIPGDDRIFATRKLAVRGGTVAVAVSILVLLIRPADLFAFPRQEPVIWMVVMLLYPLLSAMPQELIYRAFFFRRYGSLFQNEKIVGYASAIVFSFLHIIYDNGWALGFSLAGGLMFVQTWRRTRSLFWVTTEHALYGCIVFTVGMGRYFYEPF